MIKQEGLKSFVQDREKAMDAAAGWTSVGKAAAAQLRDHSHNPEQSHAGSGKLTPGHSPSSLLAVSLLDPSSCKQVLCMYFKGGKQTHS